MPIKYQKGNIALFAPLVATLLIASTGLFFRQNILNMFRPPQISWIPEKIETSVFRGGVRTVDVSFTATRDIDQAELIFTPSLGNLVKTEPRTFSNIVAGERVVSQFLIIIPQDVKQKTFVGVIQFRINRKIIARPLSIVIDTIETAQIEEALSDFFLEEFVTTTPQSPPGDRFLEVELPSEIESLIAEGTNQPIVFQVGSFRFVFSPSLEVNSNLNAGAEKLLEELENKGVRVNEFDNALSQNVWHEEDIARPLIVSGTEAITFFSVPPNIL